MATSAPQSPRCLPRVTSADVPNLLRHRRQQPAFDGTNPFAVFINKKHPVPYVFFTSPAAKTACPTSAPAGPQESLPTGTLQSPPACRTINLAARSHRRHHRARLSQTPPTIFRIPIQCPQINSWVRLAFVTSFTMHSARRPAR